MNAKEMCGRLRAYNKVKFLFVQTFICKKYCEYSSNGGKFGNERFFLSRMILGTSFFELALLVVLIIYHEHQNEKSKIE
jgi:hypothetical protein